VRIKLAGEALKGRPQRRLRSNTLIASSAIEDQYRGNHVDTIGSGKLLVRVDVDLADLEVMRQRVDGWLHVATRAAPFGPEIDQYRLPRMKHLGLPVVFFQKHRAPPEQGRMGL
jgi:hypothetical protein